mgnify:FL=1
MRMEIGTNQGHLIRRQIVPSNLYTATTKFTNEIIDQDLLNKRATSEAAVITRIGDRTYDELLEDCKMGHRAELFLIQYCGYTDNPNGFKDLYAPDGREIEIKVVSNEYSIGKVLRHLDWMRITCGYDVADKVYFFHKENEQYILKWTGKFNSERYVLEREIML